VAGAQEGWLAEHMLIVGIENPQGETHYIAAAFPSACGKTNLAMLIPPEAIAKAGWKVWTVGDDICWMRPGADGRLYAINPEAGFFGVAPGTSAKTNPNALAMLSRDDLHQCRGHRRQPAMVGRPDNDQGTPATDWQGDPYDPANGPAAHPNSRFTVSARQCPSYSPMAENPQGVPISAIVFGGRRESLVPLVFEARDWTHGVLVGASMASETTAAATGAGRRGAPRSDGDEAVLRLQLRRLLRALAVVRQAGRESCRKIFHVNWFRKGPTASSCGRASATTCACWSGSSANRPR
jgi:phosphoenolpyruvate carboxykinase (GTP)